jgi:hypothetical protein
MRGTRHGGVIAALGIAGLIGCGDVKSTSPDARDPVDGAGPGPDSAAASGAKYDIAYISDLTINPNISSLFSFLLVINKGTAPLKLNTATVVAYSDDSAAIDWQLTKNAATTTLLTPDHAAGTLVPDATAKLVDSGLVPEPIEDTKLDFMMTFPTAPASGVTLHAQAVLRIETANIVLPFTINIVASGAPKYNAAARISSQD